MHTAESTANDGRLTNCRTPRRNAPVFVIGCGRSGTTLLYHMILSAGDFAVYRTESNAINLLEPRFGDLSIRRNRERLMDALLDSKLFAVSGLDAEEILAKVVANCTNGGNFLRIVMEEMARKRVRVIDQRDDVVLESVVKAQAQDSGSVWRTYSIETLKRLNLFPQEYARSPKGLC